MEAYRYPPNILITTHLVFKKVYQKSIMCITTIITSAFTDSVLGQVDELQDSLVWNSYPFLSQEPPKILYHSLSIFVVCCYGPDVLKQLPQGHPKHALYMINLEKWQARPFCSCCLYAGSHQQYMLGEAWCCHTFKWGL